MGQIRRLRALHGRDGNLLERYESTSVDQVLIVISANLGGLAWQQPFRKNDASKYNHGFLAIICL
jgi:hypothetical protein